MGNTDIYGKIKKDEFKTKLSELELTLGKLQRQCREQKIPVMIIFEGIDAAGKGLQIGYLMRGLDPRGFQVFTIQNETEEERMHPYLWRFWTKIPEKGKIGIYDGSWYHKVSIERFEKGRKGFEFSDVYHSIRTFEKQLSDDGYIIIKFFLDIPKKEQKKRFQKLLSSQETAWRVTKWDLKRHQKYKKYHSYIEEMIQNTDTEYAPWHQMKTVDKRKAVLNIYQTVIERINRQIEHMSVEKDAGEPEAKEYVQPGKNSIFTKVDLSLRYTEEEYKKKLKKLQKKIEILHGELYRRRIPLILGFEGWDAGGKGGAVKRLTEKMDPRGFVVYPTAAPNDTEKAHHYLWRFWKDMPKAGHIAIFDRTWYGRVLVERIEGFCTDREWQRAYREINDMEKELADAGAIVIKFWMQIDKEEQERRFRERQENPEKQWKITEEDWRNREKWEMYEEAAEEMISRTSTEYAPWVIVEGNDKYYARIKVLETVVSAVERAMY